MDVNLEYLDPDTFEDLSNDLLRREVGGITTIEGAGGDDGIDGFKGEINGTSTIYQHKFFPGRLDSNRKRQIKHSFHTAQEKHPGMEKWVLLVATELTPKEHDWFEQEIKYSAPDIEVTYWNKKKIEDKVSTYQNLVERYFPTSMLALSRKQQEAVNYLSGTPVERARLVGRRLEELRDENPHLGLKYEFSSESDTHHIKLNPESPVSLNTKFDTEAEKLEKIQNGEEVRFSKEEIVSIEFDPELLIGEDMEPAELVLKPWYKDWEQDIQIEIPDSGFRKELTITAEEVSESSIVLTAKDEVFDLEIKHDVETKRTDFDITPMLEGKSVYQISEFLDFADQLETHERLLIRKLNDGEPVLAGDLDSTEIFGEMGYLQELIDKLGVIGSHTGKSFTMTTDFDEDNEANTLVAHELLTEGESIWPFSMAAEIMEGKEDALLDAYEESESPEITIEYKDFYITIIDQDVPIGDVRVVLPDPELANEDEIRRKAGQSDPVPLEVRPSDDATVEMMTED